MLGRHGSVCHSAARARELRKLGHEVRPDADVKAYVKRNKNDAADAVAFSPRRCSSQAGTQLLDARFGVEGRDFS